MKVSGSKSLLCAFLAATSLNLGVGFSAQALGDYAGSYTSGVTTDCGFPQAYTEICGDIGGASWHIYSTKSGADGPYHAWYPSGNILGSNVPSTADMKKNCKDAGWYIAYGWDGRENGAGSAYRHWGAVQWNTGVIAGADYNSSGAIGHKALKKAIDDGTILNGQKITKSAAEKIHAEGGGGILSLIG